MRIREMKIRSAKWTRLDAWILNHAGIACLCTCVIGFWLLWINDLLFFHKGWVSPTLPVVMSLALYLSIKDRQGRARSR